MAITKMIPPPHISDSPYDRQNDQEAQTYIRASYRCLLRERQAKYFLIVLAFFVCLCGIVNKYLPDIFKMFDAALILKIQSEISIYINLSSGLVIILSIMVSFYTYRMHLEGIVLQECYDCYVFKIARNQGALRPISQTMIDIYSSKVTKKTERFKNLYYESPDDVDPDTAHFDNLNRQLRSDQRLYMSVQTFFLTIWIGFCIVIFLLALSFNDDFVNTLINILFPSMSAITIIMNSWFNFRQQLKQMTNALNEIERIQREPDEERRRKMSDPFTLRCLQDALYNFRASPFVIPSFLVRRHEKQLAKESWGNGIRKSSDLIIAVNDRVTLERQQQKTNYRNTIATNKITTSLAAKKRKLPQDLVQNEIANIQSPMDSLKSELPSAQLAATLITPGIVQNKPSAAQQNKLSSTTKPTIKQTAVKQDSLAKPKTEPTYTNTVQTKIELLNTSAAKPKAAAKRAPKDKT